MYAELLAKSSFSFLEGASQPEEMVAQAKALGLHTLVICDRNGLYGAIRAWVAARELKQRIGFGVELALLSRLSQTRRGIPRELLKLCLLVANYQGYENLCAILSDAHRQAPKGETRFTLEMLMGRCGGLILLLPARVEVVATEPEVECAVSQLASWFGNSGYIATERRLDGQDETRERVAVALSGLTGFPLLATGTPLYHEPQRKPLADIVYCIRHGIGLQQAGTRVAGNSEQYLKAYSEFVKRFDAAAVERTLEVAERLRFSPEEIRYEFPCELEPGESADERLLRLVNQGARERYPLGVSEKVAQQLELELSLIGRLKVAPYFLCTQEIVELARVRRILCQGRGSAANSAVCYVLGITAVDPARSNLLFERFLSAERAEPPDIDVDFEHERREEVIQAIYEKYGREHAAMVSEVVRYQARSALREVGKVFGFSTAQLSKLSHLSSLLGGHWGSESAAEDSKESQNNAEKQIAEAGFDAQSSTVSQVLYWAGCLIGFPRHVSIHVGGFVLTRKPLHQIAPVEPATMPGRTVIPWDKDDIDALGFFKVDVLGLGMLTAIRKALELIHADGYLRASSAASVFAGELLPASLLTEQSVSPVIRAETAEVFNPLEVVTRIPVEDSAVYKLVSEADTIGVFQIESRAQMAMLPRLRPQCFYDLVIEVALVRPGPIQGGMVHPYLRRRNNEEAIEYPHPDLVPILERTLGVPLFQEQVMQLSMAGAGYTPGEADQLRRDMAAWKKTGKLLAHRERLINGFQQKGIPAEFAEALFKQIQGFGEYGFPESHAASFALLVYLSAWQKAHFPAHFAAALLNSQPMGFYSASSIVRDAQAHAVKVLKVCVSQSEWDCTLEDAEFASELCDNPTQRDNSMPCKQPLPQVLTKSLRLGLRLVSGLGQPAAERISAARKDGAYASLKDLARRAQLKKRELETLAEAGALETLIADRRQALWSVRREQDLGLWASVDVAEPVVPLRELSRVEKLVFDYQRVGLSIADHPVKHVRIALCKRGVITAKQVNEIPHGSRACMAGLVLNRQRPATASGVTFMTLEDETGVVNVVVFRRVWERFAYVATHESFVQVSGKVERQVTSPRPGEVGRATPVVHLVAYALEPFLEAPGSQLRFKSRDFR